MVNKITFTRKIKKLTLVFRVPKDSWDALKLKTGDFVDMTIQKHEKDKKPKVVDPRTLPNNCDRCGKRLMITLPPHMRKGVDFCEC